MCTSQFDRKQPICLILLFCKNSKKMPNWRGHHLEDTLKKESNTRGCIEFFESRPTMPSACTRKRGCHTTSLLRLAMIQSLIRLTALKKKKSAIPKDRIPSKMIKNDIRKMIIKRYGLLKSSKTLQMQHKRKDQVIRIVNQASNLKKWILKVF